MSYQGTRDVIMSFDEVSSVIASLPRVNLATLPTPLEEAPRLREALGPGCPRILIKRDDLTGFAFGGNKARHVEFRLADIQEKGADTLVLSNPGQSNHVRMHAALGAKFGLHTVMLKVPGEKDVPVNGNLLLTSLFGAQVVDASTDDPAEVSQELDQLIADLTSRGHTVYDVNRTPYSGAVSVFSYMSAALELIQQLEERSTQPDHIFMAGSSSASGIALVGKLLGLNYRVHPVSVRHHMPEFGQHVLDSANQAAEFLNIDVQLESSEIVPHDEYVGAGWGVPTEDCLEAQRLVARTESLVLDPVFTAKAMVALIDQVRRGAFTEEDLIVFVHTGGHPIVFAYADETFDSLKSIAV